MIVCLKEHLSVDVVVVSSGENVNVPHHLEHVQSLLKRLWRQPEYQAIVRSHFDLKKKTIKVKQTYQARCQVEDEIQRDDALHRRSSSWPTRRW